MGEGGRWATQGQRRLPIHKPQCVRGPGRDGGAIVVDRTGWEGAEERVGNRSC